MQRTAALPSLEIPIRCGRAPFTRWDDVWIHAKTHTATRFAPFKSCCHKDFVQPFRFRLPLDLFRSRHDQRPHSTCHLATANDRRGQPQILDARIRTRADEHVLYRNVGNLRSWFQSHILERCRESPLFDRRWSGGRIRHCTIDICAHPRVGSPRHLWRQLRDIKHDVPVKDGVIIRL